MKFHTAILLILQFFFIRVSAEIRDREFKCTPESKSLQVPIVVEATVTNNIPNDSHPEKNTLVVRVTSILHGDLYSDTIVVLQGQSSKPLPSCPESFTWNKIPVDKYLIFYLEPSGSMYTSILPPDDNTDVNMNSIKRVRCYKCAKSPDILSKLPSQIELMPGKSIKLSCIAKGNPIPRIRWLKDGKEINLEASATKIINTIKEDQIDLLITGDHSSVYTIYTCAAESVLGIANKTTIVSVVLNTPLEAETSTKVIKSSTTQSTTLAPKRTQSPTTKRPPPIPSVTRKAAQYTSRRTTVEKETSGGINSNTIHKDKEKATDNFKPEIVEKNFSTTSTRDRKMKELLLCPPQERNHCLNGGTCYVTAGTVDKVCSCTLPYYGALCDQVAQTSVDFKKPRRSSKTPDFTKYPIHFAIFGVIIVLIMIFIFMIIGYCICDKYDRRRKKDLLLWKQNKKPNVEDKIVQVNTIPAPNAVLSRPPQSDATDAPAVHQHPVSTQDKGVNTQPLMEIPVELETYDNMPLVNSNHINDIQYYNPGLPSRSLTNNVNAAPTYMSASSNQNPALIMPSESHFTNSYQSHPMYPTYATLNNNNNNFEMYNLYPMTSLPRPDMSHGNNRPQIKMASEHDALLSDLRDRGGPSRLY